MSSCSDRIKNRDETDIDCGGVCSPCNEGMRCIENNDCLNDNCYNNKCKKFIPQTCPTGNLVSKGEVMGCHLGYECVVEDIMEKKEEIAKVKEICSNKDHDGFLSGECLEDCNDNDADVGYYSEEILDQKDNNCNGKIDENLEKVSDESEIHGKTAGVIKGNNKEIEFF